MLDAIGVAAQSEEMDKFKRAIFFIGGCFLSASDNQRTWADRLSRLTPLGVPLGVAAICTYWIHQFHFEETLSNVPLAFALVFIIGRAFWNAFAQFDELNERQKPKFKISVINGSNSPCKIKTTNVYRDKLGFAIENRPACYFRLIVTTECANSIESCTGFLTKIEKDGKVKMENENIQLTFANGRDPDTLAKTVRNGLNQYLDILAIEEIAQGSVSTLNISSPSIPFSINQLTLFGDYGEYFLFVTVVGKDIPPHPVRLKFNWTGKMDDSDIFLLSDN